MNFFPTTKNCGGGSGITKIYNKTVYSNIEYTLDKDCNVIYLCTPLQYDGFLSLNGTVLSTASRDYPDNTSIGLVACYTYEGNFKQGDKIKFCSYSASNWQNNGGSVVFY